MNKLLWLAFLTTMLCELLLLNGCEVPPPQRELNEVYSQDSCAKVKIEGTECITCFYYVYGGRSVALSCNWK